MVSEALADQFAFELIGEPSPPWVVALSEGEIDLWTEMAASEFDSTTYDHPAWFFGSTSEIPNWTGYSVGSQLVGDYLETYPGSTAASLVNISADEFRPD